MLQVTEVIEFESLNTPPEGFYASAMGWYFHGELEDKVGYDIPSASVDLMKVPDGIYAGSYKGLACTFFNWSVIEEYGATKKRRHRGFIVLNSDKKAYEFAELAYRTKRQNL